MYETVRQKQLMIPVRYTGIVSCSIVFRLNINNFPSKEAVCPVSSLTASAVCSAAQAAGVMGRLVLQAASISLTSEVVSRAAASP